MIKDIISGKKTIKKALSTLGTTGERLDLPWK